MKLEDLVDAVRYLAVKALVGETPLLRAAKMYADGESPSVVEYITGVKRSRMRTVIARIRERCGSINRARRLVSIAVPALLEVEPVFEESNGVRRCRICGAVTREPERHLIAVHPDVLERIVRSVAERVLKALYITDVNKGLLTPSPMEATGVAHGSLHTASTCQNPVRRGTGAGTEEGMDPRAEG